MNKELSRGLDSEMISVVDVDESLALAKAESIKKVPTFKVYKEGEKVKEMVCPSHKLLEDSVTHFLL
ncbi:unnamed protein product [Brassica napus]|uniref:(rape) hypothetical protein n=1 Tax=Brassica napus TaxID=3708 RepID=A0A817AS34_BRANA|nr:unnamed protein product [Brassica napus]